jgi:iron complex transport system permease protein
MNGSAASTSSASQASGRGGSGRLVAALLALVTLLFILSLGIGPVRLAPGEVIGAFFAAPDDPARIIVLELRLPRAILAVLIGAILAAGGAALQGLLRNPLASPELFGAPQSAALAAVTVLSLGISDVLGWSLPLAAITGAFLSVFLLLAIAGRNAGLLVLILSGMAVSALAGAGTVLAMNLAPNPFAALEIAFWLLGSLQDRSMQHVVLATPFIVPALLLIYALRGQFRALTLGEDAAESLGVDIPRLRFLVILAVALGTGASVAVAGTIAFIGLVAPHLMRPFVRHDPARLIVPAALCGAALLLAADIGARLIPASSDIKVGVLTSIIGVPFFLYLIVSERRSLAGGVS